ncbi:MAG: hypothetical protein JWR72_218 [Flavisolibacter sp.]|nr:hypothetical protein [Flavisolibacter sp.]
MDLKRPLQMNMQELFVEIIMPFTWTLEIRQYMLKFVSHYKIKKGIFVLRPKGIGYGQALQNS